MSNRKLEDDEIMGDLMYAREFLNDESHWCKGVSWRGSDGKALGWMPSGIEDIQSACILGAVGLSHIFSIDDWLNTTGEYIEEIWTSNHNHSIAWWNDHTAIHKDILEFLDDAIKQRETELMTVTI